MKLIRSLLMRFTAIAAGKNHLLGLTSTGRIFAHPVNKFANHYGQLGLRKFHISRPSLLESASPIEVELIPKTLADPFVNTSRVARTTPTPFTSHNLADVDDSDIRFCTKLFEVPILRGVEAAQIAAGSRTSFLRNKDGRVLAWGANDFGYILSVTTRTVTNFMQPTRVRQSCVSGYNRCTDGSYSLALCSIHYRKQVLECVSRYAHNHRSRLQS